MSAAPPLPADGDFGPPPAAFRGLTLLRRTLHNGLEVLLVPDRAAPVLTVQVWYRVGSAHEREAGPGEDHGITGLSHFYEHLMFRGTERHPRFFDAVYQRGGELNAWTWFDATCFWERLPAGHLRFALDAEADRLAHMRLDPLDLEPEREVVKSERLLRTDDDPSGAASERLHRLAFPCHPYGWPTVGWMHDIDRITVEEADAYHRAHYTPGNAFVVVVGDVDPDEADAALADTFGALPAGPPPPRPARPVEPRPARPRKGRVEKPVSAPLVQVAWPSPAARDGAFTVLDVVHQILVRGKSARVQRALVFGDDPVATSVSASLVPMGDPYLHLFEMRVRPDRSAREAEARLLAEIARLADEPPDADELDKAVTGLGADVVRGALTTQGKADALGFSYLATGDPYAFLRRVETYAAVTPADVTEAVRRWLDPACRTVVAVTDPGGPSRVARAWLEGCDEPGAALLIEAIDQATSRSGVAAREADLDREAEALAHLDRRLRHAADLARAAGDAERLARLHDFGVGEARGPAGRAETLERDRAGNAEARLACETRGEDLRARLAALAGVGGRHLHDLAAAYLGAAPPPGPAPDARDAPIAARLLAGHLHDLRGDAGLAHAIYADCVAAEPSGAGAKAAADLAWERLCDG